MLIECISGCAGVNKYRAHDTRAPCNVAMPLPGLAYIPGSVPRTYCRFQRSAMSYIPPRSDAAISVHTQSRLHTNHHPHSQTSAYIHWRQVWPHPGRHYFPCRAEQGSHQMRSDGASVSPEAMCATRRPSRSCGICVMCVCVFDDMNAEVFV